MTVKFKSQATGDLVMLGASAKAVLALINKVPEGPGILEPADMPQALAALKNAPDEVPPPEDGHERTFSEEPISLRKRAYPLVLMIERALAADKPIVWGV